MATTIRRHPRFNHCWWVRARDALFWSDLDRIIPIHWKDSNSKSLAEGFPLSLEFWPIKVIFVRRQFKVYTIYTIVCWDPLTKIQIPCQPRRTTAQLHQPAADLRKWGDVGKLYIYTFSTFLRWCIPLHWTWSSSTVINISDDSFARMSVTIKICLNVKLTTEEALSSRTLQDKPFMLLRLFSSLLRFRGEELFNVEVFNI